MPKLRLTKICTKTGDDGSTGLGDGTRTGKDSLRVEAYGTVDELNSLIGLAIAPDYTPHMRIYFALAGIQNDLLDLGGDLCMPKGPKKDAISKENVLYIEALIEEFNARLGPLKEFVLPKGTIGASRLHVARCVCRRAERCAVRLGRKETIGKYAVQYLNRLGDLLFIMARFENRHKGIDEVQWISAEAMDEIISKILKEPA